MRALAVILVAAFVIALSGAAPVSARENTTPGLWINPKLGLRGLPLVEAVRRGGFGRVLLDVRTESYVVRWVAIVVGRRNTGGEDEQCPGAG